MGATRTVAVGESPAMHLYLGPLRSALRLARYFSLAAVPAAVRALARQSGLECLGLPHLKHTAPSRGPPARAEDSG